MEILLEEIVVVLLEQHEKLFSEVILFNEFSSEHVTVVGDKDGFEESVITLCFSADMPAEADFDLKILR